MRIILTLLAATLAAPKAEAQPGLDWPVAAGSRVRVLSPVLGKRHVTGNAVTATSDTLVFRVAGDVSLAEHWGEYSNT